MQIRKAKEEDIAAVAALYDAVCDTLEAGENYPGWAKGIILPGGTPKWARPPGSSL